MLLPVVLVLAQNDHKGNDLNKAFNDHKGATTATDVAFADHPRRRHHHRPPRRRRRHTTIAPRVPEQLQRAHAAPAVLQKLRDAERQQGARRCPRRAARARRRRRTSGARSRARPSPPSPSATRSGTTCSSTSSCPPRRASVVSSRRSSRTGPGGAAECKFMLGAPSGDADADANATLPPSAFDMTLQRLNSRRLEERRHQGDRHLRLRAARPLPQPAAAHRGAAPPGSRVLREDAAQNEAAWAAAAPRAQARRRRSGASTTARVGGLELRLP